MSAASYFDDTKNHTTSLIFNNCYTDWRGFQIQNKTILISICILIFRPLWCIFDRYIKHQFIETFNYQNLYISRLIYHLLVAKIIIIKSWKSSFFTLNKQLINMYIWSSSKGKIESTYYKGENIVDYRATKTYYPLLKCTEFRLNEAINLKMKLVIFSSMHFWIYWILLY